MLRPAALLLAALLAPLAAAHGGETQHVNPLPVDLPPGQAIAHEMTFTEGMGNGTFEAGWVFVLNALLAPGSAPVLAELHRGHAGALGETVANWTLQGQGTLIFTGLMPATDTYSMVFRHGGGDANATLLYFYDQSCACAGKPIPVEVPRGLVVFDVENVRPGATMRATFPEPRVHDLSVTLARRTNDASVWPQDFQVLQRSSAATTRDVGAGPVELHELTWTATEGGTYYFFVQSTQADPTKMDGSSQESFLASVMVTPLYEPVQPQATKPTPLGLEVLVGSLALAGLALRRRP